MASGATTNGTVSGHVNRTPKIHLYTNHLCPHAHRVHITLQELGLPFEETIIDIDTPRPEWYLKINPRGLVPAIKYTPGEGREEITLTESSIIAQFLADSFPGPLLPSSTANPLRRARIGFFADTWNAKLIPATIAMMRASTADIREAKATEWFEVVEQEIEPLLRDAAPFFGGSGTLTFAEVIAAPQLLRWYTLAEDEDEASGLVPVSLMRKLDALPGWARWAGAVRGNESVRKIFEPEAFLESYKKRIRMMIAASKE